MGVCKLRISLSAPVYILMHIYTLQMDSTIALITSSLYSTS